MRGRSGAGNPAQGPAISLSKYRLIRIKATARGAGHPSGTVLVTLRPHLALTPLELTLGKGWRGERVEVLADLTALAEPEDKDQGEGGAAAGSESDSDSDAAAPAGASASDSDDELNLDKLPAVAAYAAQVPWAEPAARADQWIVAAQDKLFLVSGQGKVRPVPVTARARRSIGGRQQRYRPVFSMVAVQPPGGAAGDAWACYLWDALGQRLWRLDAQGDLEPFVIMKYKGMACTGLAVDRAGTVYLNAHISRTIPTGAADDDPGPSQILFRITRDGVVTRLAGGRDIGRPVDGVGAMAHFTESMGLALAEDRGCAYVLDRYGKQVWVRTVSLKDGAVTSRALDHRRFNESELYGESWPVYHRGTLLVSAIHPAALYVADPATGHCRQVYWDALSPRRYGLFWRADGAPAPSGDLVPGPAFHKTRGVARATCGTLGMRFTGTISVGGDGQIAAMVKGRLGLVLLDWDDPGSVLGRSARAGTAADAGREERKVMAGAGDGMAGGGPGAWTSPQAPGMGLEPAAGGVPGAGPMETKATAAATAPGAGTSAPAPRIDRFLPAAGAPGTLVVVTGQDLDRVDQVLLGNRRIPAFLASPAGTSLVFYVPLDTPAAAPAPVVLGAPAAAGGRRDWIKSQDGFAVRSGAPAGTP